MGAKSKFNELQKELALNIYNQKSEEINDDILTALGEFEIQIDLEGKIEEAFKNVIKNCKGMTIKISEKEIQVLVDKLNPMGISRDDTYQLLWVYLMYIIPTSRVVTNAYNDILIEYDYGALYKDALASIFSRINISSINE